eukprot:496720_1
MSASTKSTFAFVKKNKVKASIVGLAAALLLRYIYVKIYRKIYQLPPGPDGLPLIGCLMHSGKLQSFFNFVTMIYGPIAYFKIGSIGFLVIGNSSLSKRVFERKELCDRPTLSSPLVPKDLISFIQMKYDNSCIKRRKLSQSIFVASCTSKHINKILTDTMLTDIIPNIEKCCTSSEGWYPKPDLTYLTWNIVFHLNFGRSVGRNDEFYKKEMWLRQQRENQSILKSLTALTFPIIVEKFPAFFEREKSIMDTQIGLYKDIIAQRRSEYVTENGPETYCDYLLDAMEQKEMTEIEGIADIFLMYIAGSETTSNTIYWGLILTAKYIDIQEQVRKELLSVCDLNGENMKFDLKKINKLPIFRAFIFEILRISCVLPRSVPRYLYKDVSINYNDKTYNIPSGTMVYNNTQFIHTLNSKYENWKGKQNEFNLMNWVIYDKNKNKYKVKNNVSFTAFGFGRRECIGRVIAFKVLQLFFGKILLKYRLELSEKDKQEKK